MKIGKYSIATLFCLAVSLLLPVKLHAQPTPGKWAIVYGSWYGSSRDASRWISEGMGGIAQVFDAKENPDLKAFDHLIIGTSIQGGRGPKELEALLQKHSAEVKQKTRALFIVCGALGNSPGPQQKKEYIDDYLAKICGVETPLAKAFAGRITKGLLSKKDLQDLTDFHKSINKPFVDYDHLSRPECMAFGKEILEKAKK